MQGGRKKKITILFGGKIEERQFLSTLANSTTSTTMTIRKQ